MNIREILELMTTAPTQSEPTCDGRGLKDDDLRGLYARSHGVVAFLDESYWLPAQARGDGHYFVAAVIVSRDVVVELREGLLDIADSDRWHTHEEAQTSDGEQRILNMTSFTADRCVTVVTFRAHVGNDDLNGEKARAACLEAMMRCLTEDHLDTDGLVVYDRRRDQGQQDADVRLFKRFRRDGIMPRSVMTYPGRQGQEPLLWAADAVAWAARRLVMLNEKTYTQPLAVRNAIELYSA